MLRTVLRQKPRLTSAKEGRFATVSAGSPRFPGDPADGGEKNGLGGVPALLGDPADGRENYGVGGVTLITASVLKIRAPGPGRPVVMSTVPVPVGGMQKVETRTLPDAVLGY